MSRTVSDVICQLPVQKARLKDWQERLERDRFTMRNFMHLDSVQRLLEQDQRIILDIEAEIQTVESMISSVEDEITRQILRIRSMGKPWAAVFVTVPLCEASCYKRYAAACSALYEPMREAGLLQ